MCIDLLNLRLEVDHLAKAGCTSYHIDVMDGNYVPNITLGLLDIKAINSISTLPLEIHLMVNEPANIIALLDLDKVATIFVHPEICTHLHRTLTQIKLMGKRPGIVLNPGSPIIYLEEVLDDVDAVMVMSVNPGFAGQKFIESTYDKLQRISELLKNKQKTLDVLVDGSISDKNIKRLIECGANGFVLGTASIFRENFDYEKNLCHLKEAAK